MAARLAQYTILGALLAALAGCAHPAPYQRPATTLPDSYRGSPPGPEDPTAVALGDQKWPEVFKDEHLQELIRKALEGNYDVRIAATRILEAEQQVVIARADQFPTVTGSLGGTAVRSAQAGPFPAYSFAAGLLSFSASWNPDFWGRYKNATEAARANLLAVGWGSPGSVVHAGGGRGRRLLRFAGTGPGAGNLYGRGGEPQRIAGLDANP